MFENPDKSLRRPMPIPGREERFEEMRRETARLIRDETRPNLKYPRPVSDIAKTVGKETIERADDADD